jgi:hypothetical protein
VCEVGDVCEEDSRFSLSKVNDFMGKKRLHPIFEICLLSYVSILNNQPKKHSGYRLSAFEGVYDLSKLNSKNHSIGIGSLQKARVESGTKQKKPITTKRTVKTREA